MSWFWISSSARVVSVKATWSYEMSWPNMLSQRIIFFEPVRRFVHIDSKACFDVRYFVFVTLYIKSWPIDVSMSCLRVGNWWFVREERICFKKTSVKCGKVVFLWSNSAAIGGEFVYVIGVFRISSLISFAANFTESSWFGISLTFSIFSIFCWSC